MHTLCNFAQKIIELNEINFYFEFNSKKRIVFHFLYSLVSKCEITNK